MWVRITRDLLVLSSSLFSTSSFFFSLSSLTHPSLQIIPCLLSTRLHPSQRVLHISASFFFFFFFFTSCFFLILLGMCFLLSNHSIKFSPIIGRQTLTLLFPPVEVLAGPPRKTRTLKAATPRHHQIPTTRAVISASAILMTTTASPLPKHTLTETTTIITTTTTLQHHHKSRCFYASHLSERHLSGVHSRLSYRCPSTLTRTNGSC